MKSKALASPIASQLLSLNKNAKIHSVFSNGFHFLLDQQLIFVSRYYPGLLGAFDLKLAHDVMAELLKNVQTGQLVNISSDKLRFYTRPQMIEVQLDHQPIPDLTYEDYIGLDYSASIDAIQGSVQKHRIYERSGFPENIIINAALQAIRDHQIVQPRQVNQLIGAGKGLTPSGDDFLQGYLMMAILSGSRQADELKEMIRAGLQERSTTLVSKNYYQALIKGYVNEPWLDFLDGIQEQDFQKIDEMIGKISHYGHTSGCDLILGVSTYIENNSKK